LDDASGFVDLHVHLHVGLDDGPARWEDALALCRALVQQGVCQAAATCHQGGAFAANRPQSIRNSTNELQRALDQAEIPLRCFPSAEWMLDSVAVETLADRLSDWLTIADGGRYALIEFPFQFPAHARIVGDLLRQLGIRPVLAHVEKFPQLATNPKRIRGLREEGYVIQVNADSIVGWTPDSLDVVCRRLIRSGLVDVVASDAHSIDRRPPMLREAYGVVTRWTDPATAQLLFAENPKAIVEGGDILPPKPASWFSRLRRR
jgi:protein-tyrosine phosphatase